MIRLRESLVVAAPRDAAFGLVADFIRLPEWDPSVMSVDLVAGAPLTVGAELLARVRFLGVIANVEYTLTAVDEPTMVEYHGIARLAETIDRVRVASLARGTEITFEAEMTTRRWLRAVEPVLPRLMRAQTERALAGLEAHLGPTSDAGG